MGKRLMIGIILGFFAVFFGETLALGQSDQTQNSMTVIFNNGQKQSVVLIQPAQNITDVEFPDSMTVIFSNGQKQSVVLIQPAQNIIDVEFPQSNPQAQFSSGSAPSSASISTPASSPSGEPTTERLGTVWETTEGMRKGRWTRRGTTNIFDGYSVRDPRIPASVVEKYNLPDELRAVLTVVIDGNSVYIQRRQDTISGVKGDCDYTGTLSPDGRQMEGTFSCNPNLPYKTKWKALKVEGLASSTSPAQPSVISPPSSANIPASTSSLFGGPTTDQLGTEWLTREGWWEGRWTRRGTTNVFDGHWIKGPSVPASVLEKYKNLPDEVRAVLTIVLEGNSVYVKRTQDTMGGVCDYTGTLSPDGRLMEGTFNCNPKVPIRIEWKALKVEAMASSPPPSQFSSGSAPSSVRTQAPASGSSDGPIMRAIPAPSSGSAPSSVRTQAPASGSSDGPIMRAIPAPSSGNPPSSVRTQAPASSSSGGPITSATPANRLANSWEAQEGIWRAWWTRRGTTNVFEGRWENSASFPKMEIRAVLAIVLDGNSVNIKRRQGTDRNDCDYTGTLSSDGRQMEGTYSCSKDSIVRSWKAWIPNEKKGFSSRQVK